MKKGLLILLSALAAACGGGGGGGGGGGTTPNPPTPPQAGITFTASGSPTGPAVLLARDSSTTTTRLALRVDANQVQDVYGVAFDLQFPGTLLAYDGVSEGSFLSSGGADVSLQVAQLSANRLVIGLTRLGTVSGVGGSGTLLTLFFDVSSAGTGSFSFAQNRAFDSTGAERNSVSWLGGSVSITQ